MFGQFNFTYHFYFNSCRVMEIGKLWVRYLKTKYLSTKYEIHSMK